MVVAADAAHPVVQALVRWDPAWLAERELADRRELGFPPVTRIASLAGSPAALAEFLAAPGCPTTPTCWARCPSRRGRGRRASGSATWCGCRAANGLALARALAEVQGVRSAKKVPEHVRVQLDPLDLV